ncbi:hypothetical protein LV779_02965 [Streptomyces thinghirensis]|nr:hypothetical protein [Streptomyces thinghirensis]
MVRRRVPARCCGTAQPDPLRPAPEPRPDEYGEHGAVSAPLDLGRQDVLALSWTSRHAATLTPVLAELARGGQRSLLLDLATDAAERCSAGPAMGFELRAAPSNLFTVSGTAEGLHRPDDEHVVQVEGHGVQLARLVRLLSVLLETSGAAPSRRGGRCAARELARRHPVDHPAAHRLAEQRHQPTGRAGRARRRAARANSVHAQHGAWTPESVAWPALHTPRHHRHGRAGPALGRGWARHPEAEVHVSGSPASTSSPA